MNDRSIDTVLFDALRQDITSLRQDIQPHISRVSEVIVRHENRITVVETSSALRDRELRDIADDLETLKKDSQTQKGMWVMAGLLSGATFSIGSLVIGYFSK
jgi:hypothetical protein